VTVPTTDPHRSTRDRGSLAGSGRTRAARRWLGRAGWALLGALATGAVLYLNAARRGGELAPWHTVVLDGELRAGRTAVADLADYLALETRLFAETRQKLGTSADGMAFSRFDPSSDTWPGRFGRDWNRTFELGPAAGIAPAGGALLLHGLSDSPYSLRALGEILAARGYYVLGLRSPGHGTAPAALARASRDDWRKAVRLGARAVADRAGDRPFVIAGYSNGALLAVDYALAARADEELPSPDRLVLLSPALALGRLAAAAPWQRRLAALPGLHELGWVDVLPEYDPWKYNSFPIQAAEQIYELSEEVARGLARIDGRGGGLPPVLAFQSAVDDTVPVPTALPRLVEVLGGGGGAGSELVLFDVNRMAQVEYFLRRDILDLVDSFVEQAHPFALTVVTNRSADTAEVEARHRAPGGEWVATALGLAWPPAVYSLSHVALPFPPDDPFYGSGEGAGGPFPLGRLEPRGERAAITVPIQLLMRLRYNPFFAVVEERVLAFLPE
jgi:esterase/lipase